MIHAFLPASVLLLFWTMPGIYAKLAICSALAICLSSYWFKCDSMARSGKLTIAALGWAAICSTFAISPSTAVWGLYGRWEGLVTWLTIFGIAMAIRPMGALPIGSAIVLWTQIDMVLRMANPDSAWILTPIACGALSACSFAYLLAMCPVISWIAMMPLVFSSSRAGLVACIAVAIAVYFCKPRKIKIGRESLFVFASAIVLAGGLMLHPSFRQKIANIGFDFTGSRSQWAMQGITEATRLPLTGHGPDNIHMVITPAIGPTAHANAVADRTHNVALDILLQTGWIGLALCVAVAASAIIALRRSFREVSVFECDIDLIDDTEAWRSHQSNMAAVAVLAAWTAYGLLNPQGAPSHLLMLAALFQMKGKA